MSKHKRFIFIVFLGSIYLSFLLVPITQGVFFFAFDQARDLLWVKDQFDMGRPTLIGPWGSLAGVFFGPLWFWLLSVPYFLSNGSPIAITLFNSLVIYATGVVGLFLFWKHNRILALSIFLLCLLSPSFRLLASYSFSQHLLPLLMIILIYCYTQLLHTFRPLYLYLALFIISLMFHAEPPTALASLLSFFAILYFTPSKKTLFSPRVVLCSIGIFLFPFMPLVLFDIRHNFMQVKAVSGYFQGTNESLGGVLPFVPRISDRVIKILDTFRQTFFYSPSPFSYVLLSGIGLVSFFFKKDNYIYKVLQASGLYLLTVFISFLIYKPELKGFYLDGLVSVFIIIASCVIALVWSRAFVSKVLVVGVIVLLFIQQVLFTTSLLSGAEQKKAFASGSLFANQQAIVSWIYEKAEGRGFSAYTYSSALFDYPYQYLFMWMGVKEFGYLPSEFSYLPNKPEYVQNKSIYLERNKNLSKKPAAYVFLIIESDRREGLVPAWLSNFSNRDYPVLDVKTFPDGTKVEMRKNKATD